MSVQGWEAPPDEWLNFSNCSTAAYWLATFVDQRYRDTQGHDAPAWASYQYIRSIMPTNMTRPNFGQAMAWYQTMGPDDPVWQQFYHFPLWDCPVELCKELRWSGDSDLAGIGVMAVYYLAAIFSTLYFVVLAVDKFKPFSGDSKLTRAWDKTTLAFRESLPGFIDAGQLFAIAMLVASSYRHGSSRIHPDKTHSIYGLENSSYLAVFSLFPPLLLQMVARDLRRRKTRLIMWTIIIILAFVVSALYLNMRTSTTQLLRLLDRDSATTDVFWQVQCDPEDLRWVQDGTLMCAEALLIVNMLWHLFGWAPITVRAWVDKLVSKSKVWHIIGKTVKVLNGIFCCTLMWVMLGLFTEYRRYFERIMGSTNQDSQWSFGQIFALATWVPVAIDLISIFAHGAKEGLEGKVSERYQLVEVEPSTHVLELDPLQMPAEPQYSQVQGGLHDGQYEKAYDPPPNHPALS